MFQGGERVIWETHTVTLARVSCNYMNLITLTGGDTRFAQLIDIGLLDSDF